MAQVEYFVIINLVLQMVNALLKHVLKIFAHHVITLMAQEHIVTVTVALLIQIVYLELVMVESVQVV